MSLMNTRHKSKDEDGLSKNDVILLVKRENSGQNEITEKIYLRKSTFNMLVAEWKPYINGVKWFFAAILTSFGMALVALVFNAARQ